MISISELELTLSNILLLHIFLSLLPWLHVSYMLIGRFPWLCNARSRLHPNYSHFCSIDSPPFVITFIHPHIYCQISLLGMRWYKGQSVPFMNVFNPDSQVWHILNINLRFPSSKLFKNKFHQLVIDVSYCENLRASILFSICNNWILHQQNADLYSYHTHPFYIYLTVAIFTPGFYYFYKSECMTINNFKPQTFWLLIFLFEFRWVSRIWKWCLQDACLLHRMWSELRNKSE